MEPRNSAFTLTRRTRLYFDKEHLDDFISKLKLNNLHLNFAKFIIFHLGACDCYVDMFRNRNFLWSKLLRYNYMWSYAIKYD